MSKFKVGDRVRVVGNTNPYHFMEVGKEYTVTSLEGADIGYGDIQIEGYDRDGDFVGQSVCFDDVELIAESVTNTIQLNHQYTSKNGQKWECIAVRGDVAWLASGLDGEAYRFLLNGENLSQGGGVWDIKWEPVVEWRTNTAHLCDDGGSLHMELGESGLYSSGVTVTIKYPVVEGKPDFTQASVTPACEG